MTALLTTNLGATPLLGRGKVRDLYAVGGALLLVATDRISAFDHVLATGIPDKGKILTQISLFWFDLLEGSGSQPPDHGRRQRISRLVAALRRSVGRPLHAGEAGQYVPVECVARGYLAGSGWKEYQASGTVCGIPLPGGLQDGSRLPEPMFTPATKARTARTTRTSPLPQTEKLVGAAEAAELRRLTLAIYSGPPAHAEACGLILADTKFEFGRTAEGIILADEVLTPDSSRFWDGNGLEARRRAAFVRQAVRARLS